MACVILTSTVQIDGHCAWKATLANNGTDLLSMSWDIRRFLLKGGPHTRLGPYERVHRIRKFFLRVPPCDDFFFNLCADGESHQVIKYIYIYIWIYKLFTIKEWFFKIFSLNFEERYVKRYIFLTAKGDYFKIYGGHDLSLPLASSIPTYDHDWMIGSSMMRTNVNNTKLKLNAYQDFTIMRFLPQIWN